jgi:prolyl-tRNA synthetase
VPKVAVEVELPDVKQKTPYPLVDAPTKVAALLVDIQKRLYAKAKAFRDANTHVVDTYADFKAKLDAPGGFFLAHWDGTRETEDLIAAETKATIRCIPSDGDKTPGQCMVTGRPSKQRVIFARSY